MGINLGRFRSDRDKSEWAEWLADDPVPASMRARMRANAVREASTPVVRRPGQPLPSQSTIAALDPKEPSSEHLGRTISINVALPKFKKLSVPRELPKLPKNLTYKQLGIGSSVLLVVVVVGVLAVHTHSEKGNKTGNTEVLGSVSQKADFSTLTAGSSKSASEKKFDPTKKVVSYTDSIGGVTITVSQQQLPGGFQDKPDEKVKKLAADFSANEVLSTANPTAYLGTSAKGPQTVIFTKNGLLVFIQSAKKIDNHDWAEYITNLK